MFYKFTTVALLAAAVEARFSRQAFRSLTVPSTSDSDFNGAKDKDDDGNVKVTTASFHGQCGDFPHTMFVGITSVEGWKKDLVTTWLD